MPKLARAHAAYAKLRDYLAQASLDRSGGRDGLYHRRPGRAGRPGATGARREAGADAARPAGGGRDARTTTSSTDLYEAPNFQQGKPPYKLPADGGGIIVEKGEPVPARTETLRFALTVPKGTHAGRAAGPSSSTRTAPAATTATSSTRAWPSRLAAPGDLDGTPLPPLAMVEHRPEPARAARSLGRLAGAQLFQHPEPGGRGLQHGPGRHRRLLAAARGQAHRCRRGALEPAAAQQPPPLKFAHAAALRPEAHLLHGALAGRRSPAGLSRPRARGAWRDAERGGRRCAAEPARKDQALPGQAAARGRGRRERSTSTIRCSTSSSRCSSRPIRSTTRP